MLRLKSNNVHCTVHWTLYNVHCLGTHLGAGEPGPVIWIGSPGVRMLDGEGEAVVDGRHGDAGLLLLLHLPLDVADEPVVVAPVRVADDVVQHHQFLKL